MTESNKRPRTSKSPIWEFFTRDVELTDGKERVVCKLCEKVIKRGQGSGTTNMYQHLRCHHPDQFAPLASRVSLRQCQPSSTTSITSVSSMDAFNRVTSYIPVSKRHKECENAIAQFLALDCVPIYTVEQEGFRRMLKVFDSKFECPSHAHFEHDLIPRLYISAKEKITHELADIKYYSITSDLWSAVNMNHYISLTIHYIDKNWCFQSRTLETRLMPEDYTDTNITEQLDDMLATWSITKDKLVSITTDCSSNMKVAAMIWEVVRLTCFGLVLQNGIQLVLQNETVHKAITEVRRMVEAFSFSWMRKQSLVNAQEELGFPVVQLETDLKTRWESTLEMIKSVLYQEDAIRRALSDHEGASFLPSHGTFAILHSVQQAVEPLEQLTDLVSGDTVVTGSSVLPTITIIQGLCRTRRDNSPLTNTLRVTFLQYVLEKFGVEYVPAVGITLEPWGDNEDAEGVDTTVPKWIDEADSAVVIKLPECPTDTILLLATAAFLDPRYKAEFFGEDLKEKVMALLTQEETSLDDSPSCSAKGADYASLPPVSTAPKVFNLGSMLKKTLQQQASFGIRSELNKYLALPLADTEGDPLAYWKVHNSEFPKLAKLAKKYLSSCASSVASERLFVMAGNVVTKEGSSLKPEMVNQLVFLTCNRNHY